MLEFWPSWLRSYWLLALVPLLWLTWRQYQTQQRRGKWELLLPPSMQGALLSTSKTQTGKRRWLWLCAGWILMVLALAGPSWQHYEQPATKPFAPLVIMLELTPEMLARDGRPTRLEQAKHKILDLLKLRQDAPTAIIVFAGSAHTLVPLTEDQATITNLLDALSPELMPISGHRPDLALTHAQALLKQGAQGRGDILLITSQLSDDSAVALAKSAEALRRPLRVLGVGSLEGAPILNDTGGFVRDQAGVIKIAKLAHNTLKGFAADNGFLYQRIRLDDSDLNRLQLRNPATASAPSESRTLNIQLDQGYWLVVILVLMAAFAGRRGLIMSVALLLCLPPSAWSMNLTDLWLRADQQGARALEQQLPLEAAKHFQDPLWKGYALYQAGLYQEAAHAFATVDSATAHYNRGTALAAVEQYEEAIDALKQALTLDPGLVVAKNNLEAIEHFLANRPQESSPESLPGDVSPSVGSASEPSPATLAEPQPSTDNSAQQTSVTATQSINRQDSSETAQSLEQWLRQVPDNPGELLKRKFLLELQQRQGAQP